eukprot:1156674-Pelagomonas_calceolata.AAC.24
MKHRPLVGVRVGLEGVRADLGRGIAPRPLWTPAKRIDGLLGALKLMGQLCNCVLRNYTSTCACKSAHDHVRSDCCSTSVGTVKLSNRGQHKLTCSALL